MRKQLDLLEDQAASMHKQTQVIEGGLIETKKAAEAAVVQAKAAQVSARASLQSSQMALDAAQPVIITKVELGATSDANIDFRILLQNDGGGVGRVWIDYCFLLRPSASASFTVRDCGDMNAKGPFVVSPRTPHETVTRLEGPAVKEVRQGKLYLFLVGIIYLENSPQAHAFCGAYRFDFGSVGDCSDFDPSQVIKGTR